MKSVGTWSFSGRQFLVFGLIVYEEWEKICKWGKISTRKTPNMDTFYSVLANEVHWWYHQPVQGPFSGRRHYTVNTNYVNHMIEVTVSSIFTFNQEQSLFQVSIPYYLWKFIFRKCKPMSLFLTLFHFVVPCTQIEHELWAPSFISSLKLIHFKTVHTKCFSKISFWRLTVFWNKVY